jgi:Zn-dependent protease
MDFSLIETIALYAVPVVFAITLHEAAHGYVARHFGDSTAYMLGRVTLNPITMEDMTRIWSVFPDTPYEISVSYLVTPVAIDSAREDIGAPVVDQVHEQGQRGAELTAAGT